MPAQQDPIITKDGSKTSVFFFEWEFCATLLTLHCCLWNVREANDLFIGNGFTGSSRPVEKTVYHTEIEDGCGDSVGL